MPDPALLAHPASLEHDTGPHPECAARIEAIEAALAARDDLGYARERSPSVERDALLAVHPASHVDRVEAVCARGSAAIDGDTIVCGEASLEAARRAAGGAVRMVDRLLGDGAPVGASLHRPPGHHAERNRAMGFCLYNNIAIAARHALDAHGVERVMVLDWDVHHGNGTCEIFDADPRVLVVSIHQWPLYPGTGRPGERGEGNIYNLPVPPGSGDATFAGLVEHVAVPLGHDFAPGLVLVSAGYDAHADDPLANCEVTDDGYRMMAGSARRLAGELGVPAGIVLEGGYDTAALARSVVATLEVMAGQAEAPAPPRRDAVAERGAAYFGVT